VWRLSADNMNTRYLLFPLAFVASTLSGATACSSDAATEDDDLTSCGSDRAELVLWSGGASFDPILDKLTPNVKCTHYFVGVPLNANDKTNFHGNVASEIAAIHKRGSNFHALAEFHWGSWRDWAAKNNKTWEEAGVEFRKRMATAGFDLHDGDSDTWAINELPSTLIVGNSGISSATVRDNAKKAITGLYDGAGSVHKKGAIYRVTLGQDTSESTLANAKPYLESFLADSTFWASMSQHVRWWGDEVYADPLDECQPSTVVGARAQHINDYVFHLPRLATSQNDSAARSFLQATFTPILNGAWKAPVGYGRNDIPGAQFEDHVATEVYAVRAWQSNHTSYGKRLGFAWAPPSDAQDQSEAKTIGNRIGTAVSASFVPGAHADAACGGASYPQCQCKVSNAQFTGAWAKEFP
jgi:hypothetical protein